VLKCKLADEIDGVDPTSCLAQTDRACLGLPALLAEKLGKAKTKVKDKCSGLPLYALESFLGGLGFANVDAACSGSIDADALVDCVIDNAACAVEKEVFIRDPRAQESLTTKGIAASFPCVAP
jgi:hypothetical protein